MDILKAEIERKKRQLKESDVLAPDKKYFKRSELAAKQTEEYLRKHYPHHLEENTNNQKIEELSTTVTGKTKGDKEQFLQPRKEVIRKLRERGEPITLFGESRYDSYLRLKKLESQMPDASNTGVGENDFKAAMDAVDLQYLNDLIQSTDTTQKPATESDVSVKDDGTTEEDIAKMREQLGTGNSHIDQDIILRFFKFILKRWGDYLNARPADEKRTLKGKMASATHTQTVSYLKPLFRILKAKLEALEYTTTCGIHHPLGPKKVVDNTGSWIPQKMEEGLLECFVEIVQYTMDRHYIKANDAYLEMAIGNAPWPIGVTMVGIHARTGREKISSKYVAHALNDETQRKYIQAIKRLMTKCQKFFPTAPSRSFNYDCPV